MLCTNADRERCACQPGGKIVIKGANAVRIQRLQSLRNSLPMFSLNADKRNQRALRLPTLETRQELVYTDCDGKELTRSRSSARIPIEILP